MKVRIVTAVMGLYFAVTSITSANAASRELIKSSTTGEEIEYYWAKPEGVGPFPALLLIHPDQDSPKIGGEVFVKSGQLDYWTHKGYFTVAISQPGYGESAGSPDFCGPKTQHATADVIKHLQSSALVDPKQIFVYGGSRGAVVGSMIAATGLNLRGVILKSGVYDLIEWSRSRPWYDSIKLTMFWEIGWPTREKLQERSAYYYASKIKAPVLIIHGTKDDRAPLSIAEKFTDRINATGGKAELVRVDSEHVIPMPQINVLVGNFLEKAREAK